MCPVITKDFAIKLNNLDGKEYFKMMLSYIAAPTIEKKKPSTLITFKHCRKNKKKLWERYGSEFCRETGLNFYILAQNDTKITVLLFNKERLETHLNTGDNKKMLRKFGYHCDLDIETVLSFLKCRYQQGCPHEIGVFLGIPVEDICGFIENEGRSSLLCKYWKVYHNKDRAEKMFNEFDQAREKAITFFTKNVSLG